MRILFIFILTVVLLAGVSFAKTMEMSKTVDDMTIKLVFDKSTPVVGVNGCEIEILDSSGNQLTDVDVRIEYSMPPMPGMPPMNYKSDAQLKGKVFLGKIDLSMSGSWNIALKVKRNDKTSTARFSVDAR